MTLLRLTKFPIALLSALTFLAFSSLSARASAVAFFVALLICGALALNSWQDRKVDALMTRTFRRPLVTGEVGTRTAVVAALTLIAAGLFGILHFGGPLLTICGASGVAIYNLVYTPLKKVTMLAYYLGFIAGCVPVLMGLLENGTAFGPYFYLPLLYLFMWQALHTLLLHCLHLDDFKGAGLPVMNEALVGAVNRSMSRRAVGRSFMFFNMLMLAVCIGTIWARAA